jgi:polyhydroxybutyrate depolymerase
VTPTGARPTLPDVRRALRPPLGLPPLGLPPSMPLLAAALTMALGACAPDAPRTSEAPGTPQLSAGSREHTLTHAGVERRYLVDSPGAQPGQLLPLVVILHGGGGNAENARESMRLGALNERHGALVMYAEGTAKKLMGRSLATWNAGACCGAAAREQVDDVGYLRAALDDVATRYPVDPARVYLTGHSNGAMMAYRAACELADRVAAIAPVGGQPPIPACKPSVSVPTLHLHGETDRCARYEGGTCGGCFSEVFGLGGGADDWACAPVPAALSAWAQAQGCTPTPTPDRREHGARCHSFEGCTTNVTLCTLPDLGHAFPGGTNPLCQRAPESRVCKKWQTVLGPDAPDYPTADVLWSFFSRHSRGSKAGG